MTAQPHEPMSIDEFIAWEHAQETKHEFASGRIIDFAGGTLGHAGLATGLIVRIAPHVRPCMTFGSDALIRASACVRYPDVVVTCDPRDASGAKAVRHPKLIIEILSESTAAVDRGDKLDEYRSIESLEEYALVDSRRRWTVTYRRAGAEWIASLPATTGYVRLESIDLDVDLDALYDECGIAADGTPSGSEPAS